MAAERCPLNGRITLPKATTSHHHAQRHLATTTKIGRSTLPARSRPPSATLVPPTLSSSHSFLVHRLVSLPGSPDASSSSTSSPTSSATVVLPARKPSTCCTPSPPCYGTGVVTNASLTAMDGASLFCLLVASLQLASPTTTIPSQLVENSDKKANIW